MYTIRMACCAVVLSLAAGFSLRASEGFDDLVKQVQAGLDDTALRAYIEASPVAYDLGVDEILYLNDLGVSSETIAAIISHGKKLAAQPPPEVTPPVAPPTVSMAPPPVPEAEVPVPEAPPPVAYVPPQPLAEPVFAPDPGAAPEPLAQEVVRETVTAAPVVVAAPSEGADISFFYNSLSPYGTWLNVDGAWYWRPTAVLADPGWQPYCQRGHWVYTDWGWAWQSGYSWGWAPFHYGRWHRHPRHGWMWAPDNVWGPAWVSWRHTDTAIGWAPLPPGSRYEFGVGFHFGGRVVGADFDFGLREAQFAFVPVEHFHDPMLWRHTCSRVEVTRIYTQTTIIQNNYEYSEHRIINRGPSVTRISQVTHQEIKKVTIVQRDIAPGQAIRRDNVVKDHFAVYRPQLAPTVHETPKAVVERRQTQAVLVAKRQESPVFRPGPVPPHGVLAGREGPEVKRQESPLLKPVPVPSHVGVAGREDPEVKRQESPLLKPVPVPSHSGGTGRESPEVGRPPLRPAVESPFHIQKGGATPEDTRKAEENEVRRRQAEEENRKRQELSKAQETAARERQAEEAKARQRDEQKRTFDAARQQEAQRAAQETARRQDEQRRAQEAARLNDEQRRAQDAARQQQAQRQAQDAARQQDEQRRAQDAARQQQAQRQAQDAARQRAVEDSARQRQAEESAARQRQADEAARQRQLQDSSRREAPSPQTYSTRGQASIQQAAPSPAPAPSRPSVSTTPPASAFQGYGNAGVTDTTSKQGASSTGSSDGSSRSSGSGSGGSSRRH